MANAITWEDIPISDPLLGDPLDAPTTSRWSRVWSVASKAITVTTTTLALVGRLVLAPTHRIKVVCSYAVGLNIGFLLQSFVPSTQILHRLHLEALRLGMPLYFLLTQLFILSDDETEKEFYIESMMALFGLQTATTIHRLVTYRFPHAIVREIITDSPMEREFRLIDDNTYARITEVTMMALTGTALIVVSKVFVENPEGRRAGIDIGAFYLGQAFMIPIGNIFMHLQHKMERDNLTDVGGFMAPSVATPTPLQLIRVANAAFKVGLPIGTVFLFYRPDAYRIAAAGGMYGFLDEMFRFSFSHRQVYNFHAVYPQKLDSKVRIVEVTWRVARLAGELIGLGFFMNNIVQDHNPLFNEIGGTVVGSAILGYGTIRAVDLRFNLDRSGSLMTTLFFRTFERFELLGLPPIFIYWYLFQAGIGIGSDHLANPTVTTKILASLAWGGYALTYAQEAAVLDSFRLGEALRIPLWLWFANLILALEVWNERV